MGVRLRIQSAMPESSSRLRVISDMKKFGARALTRRLRSPTRRPAARWWMTRPWREVAGGPVLQTGVAEIEERLMMLPPPLSISGAARVMKADEVGVHHLGEHLGLAALGPHEAAVGPAGVVHQHVDAIELGHRHLHDAHSRRKVTSPAATQRRPVLDHRLESDILRRAVTTMSAPADITLRQQHAGPYDAPVMTATCRRAEDISESMALPQPSDGE
jgi:hypothetical protein